MDLLWIIENQISENLWNEHLRGNHQIDRSNEIQILQFIYQWKAKNQGNLKNQNDWILICKLKVIDPESQHLTSDERWTVLGQTSNWMVKWNRNSMNLLSTEIWRKAESNETKIKWFGIIIGEISYFPNQKCFGQNFRENEEHWELIWKIKLLNLIKTQITSW